LQLGRRPESSLQAAPALGGALPGDIYTTSARTCQPPDDPDYPYHDKVIRVTRCGRICPGQRKIKLSVVFDGQLIGIRNAK
jgi:putative transposase